jgi:type VI secretion system protein VasG
MLASIVRLQLGRIKKRILENHKLPFDYDEGVVQLIVSRCTELESGGRMIDAILTNTVLPKISEEFLKRMVEGEPVSRVRVGVEGGDFRYEFDQPETVQLAEPGTRGNEANR